MVVTIISTFLFIGHKTNAPQPQEVKIITLYKYTFLFKHKILHAMTALQKIWIFGLLLTSVRTQAQVFFKGDVSNQGVGLGVVLAAAESNTGGFRVVNFAEDFKGFGFGAEASLFETNNFENGLVLAPRISYEHHFSFLPVSLGSRMNGLYYTNFRQGAFVFRPEAGVTHRGNIYLFYGYNIVFQDTALVPVRHQLTLGFTLPPPR